MTTVTKQSLVRRSRIKRPPRMNVKEKRKKQLSVVVVLHHEPLPLPLDRAPAKPRMASRSGRWKKSESGKKKPRLTWRLRRTPGTKASRSLDSTTKKVVVKYLLTYAAAGFRTISTDIRPEVARSGGEAVLGAAADSGMRQKIETETEKETETELIVISRGVEIAIAIEIGTEIVTGTETEETGTEIAIRIDVIVTGIVKENDRGIGGTGESVVYLLDGKGGEVEAAVDNELVFT